MKKKIVVEIEVEDLHRPECCSSECEYRDMEIWAARCFLFGEELTRLIDGSWERCPACIKAEVSDD